MAADDDARRARLRGAGKAGGELTGLGHGKGESGQEMRAAKGAKRTMTTTDLRFDAQMLNKVGVRCSKVCRCVRVSVSGWLLRRGRGHPPAPPPAAD